MQIIARVLAANQVSNIWIPQHGIMTTPAVSATIRARQAQGAIILTASHNPGGPDEDFGIKYNLALGQPAGEDFTERVRESVGSVVNGDTMRQRQQKSLVPKGSRRVLNLFPLSTRAAV